MVGVDIKPQPHYPYPFIQDDAMAALGALNRGYIYSTEVGNFRLGDFSAIHASPPCQGYSITKSVSGHAGTAPLLIPEVRRQLVLTGLPWVIENVEGAKYEMQDYVTLCGSQFGRHGLRHGKPVYLRRHRLFEANFTIPDAGPHRHHGHSFPVFGNGPAGKRVHPHLKGPGTADFARGLMGMDWGTLEEVNQALPPVYTNYIGTHLMAAIAEDVAA